MRNLKKILAMALALAMVLSVTAFAGFTDAEKIDDNYSEAVQVLTGMEVIKGYTDGSFKPEGTITRAEVAAIIYRIATQDVEDDYVGLYAGLANFSDVKAADWFAGYVGYCANAGYIKGYPDGTFKPQGLVKGFEALAMILRAMGYDAENEFTGVTWSDKVAKAAYQAGIMDELNGDEKLANAADRELVAQMAFTALAKAPIVRYTPAFGYTTTKTTLGDAFDLVKYDSTDKFGRPCYVYEYNTGDEETEFAYKADATYTVEVDECDIAADLGLSKDRAITKAYVDGVLTKVDNNDTIEVRGTTKYIGDQGLLTEVYNLGATKGIHVVQINTYLAKVTSTSAKDIDKNGHVKDATADFYVWDVNSTANYTLTYKTEAFATGDYALVNVAKGGKDGYVLVNPVATEAETAGLTNAWTTYTTTVNEVEYDNACQFELNKGVVRAFNNKCWDIFVDQYGNLIGAVETGTNYLVIEKIEWKHAANTIGEGYALADIVLADGSKLDDVVIDEINGYTADNSGDSYGFAPLGTVSDSYVNNGEVYYMGDQVRSGNGYYEHIWTYTVNEDGSYNITAHGQTYFKHAENVEVVNGQATIGNDTNHVVATSKTVYLIEDANGYTYTVYVGKNAVPSGTADDMCALLNSEGYAKLVVLNGWTPANSSFFAYVTDETADYYNTTLGTGYKVYKMGETSATVVFDYYNNIFTEKYTESGIYEFQLDVDGCIVSMSSDAIFDLKVKEDYIGTDWAEDGLTYGRVLVEGKEDNTSFSTQEYAELTLGEDGGNDYAVAEDKLGAAWKDFNVTEDTIVIKVTKNGTDAKLASSSMSSVGKGDVVIVGYTSVGNFNTAKIVYVIKNDHKVPVVAATEAKVAFTLTIKSTHENKDEVVYDLGSVNVTAGEIEFTLKHTSTHIDWNADASAKVVKDARVTGLTLSQYIDPALGTTQVVTVDADDLGTTIPVNFVLYID